MESNDLIERTAGALPMSADTIPNEASSWEYDTQIFDGSWHSVVTREHPDILGNTYRNLQPLFADRSTRPAEPAAPVAEAGDGEVAVSLAHLNIGYLYGIADALEHTDFTRAGDIRQCLLQVVKGLSASAATLEAERARADATEQRAADALARVKELEFGAGFEAAFDAVVRPGSRYENWRPADDPAEIVTDLYNDLEDALARAEKAEGALETAREDERDRLYGIALKDMEGRSMRAQHSHSAALWLRLEGAMDTYSRLAARSAATETAADGGDNE